jgi:hypothetical protein
VIPVSRRVEGNEIVDERALHAALNVLSLMHHSRG